MNSTSMSRAGNLRQVFTFVRAAFVVCTRYNMMSCGVLAFRGMGFLQVVARGSCCTLFAKSSFMKGGYGTEKFTWTLFSFDDV